MAIVEVEEDFSGRTGSQNSTYERRYTRYFDVTTSDPIVGPLAILLHDDIPKIGDYYENGADDPYDDLYEYDLGAFVNERTVDAISGPEGAGIYWRVTVQYGPNQPFDSDPTLHKIRVQFGGERTERVVDFDRNGIPIRNSAGDRFGDPVTVDSHITTLLITRNERVSTFNPALAHMFGDTINQYTWNGFAPGYCKMGIISTGEEQFDSNSQTWYYKVTYPVQIGRKPWLKELLDQGFNELAGGPYYGGGDVKTVPIMNEGQPVSDPVTLDGNGHRLPPGDPPVTLTFDVEDVADWSGLNINMSLRLGL